MKRTMSRRSHSWWWDSHISPKNSKWLAENLEEMDQAVKQMLKLIEEDGDSFAKKAEMYYQKRPELVAHVEAFYRIYRALAERYDNVTGELRKTIPSELQSQGSGSSSDFGFESPSPSPSHENRPPRPKQSHRAAGFDFFLGAGHSQKGSDGSSSSSDSESDSDNATSKNHLSCTGENENGEKLHMRIIELENELSGMSEKLQACEGKKLVENENCEMLHMKISKVEEKLLVEKEKNMVLEEEITRLKHELKQKESSILLRDSEFETKPFHEENELVEPELELDTNLVRDPNLELDRNLARDLQERIATLESEVSSREHTIEELKLEIANGKERFSQEKSQLELEHFALSESRDAELKLEKNLILYLQDQIVKLEAESSDRGSTIEELEATISDATEQFSKDKLQLEGVISGLMKSHEMLEIKFIGLQDEIKQLNAEKFKMRSEIEILKNERNESCRQVEELSHDFDGIKLKYDTLAAEKDELFAKLHSLVADVSSRDDRIRQMDEHLHRLHVEHMELIKGCQDAQKVSGELSAKVRALEEEVERQRVTISDHAEGKREAIRQLCFSLEHYRDGYEKLRQALHGNKRPTIMAS